MSSQGDVHSDGEGSAAPLRRSQRPRRSATQTDDRGKKMTGRKDGKADSSGSEAEDDDMLVMDEDEEEPPSDASSGEEFEAPKSSRKKSAGGRKSGGGAGGTPTGLKRGARTSAASTSAVKRKRPAAGKKTTHVTQEERENELDGVESGGEGRPKKARTAASTKGRQTKGAANEPAAIKKDNIFFNSLFTNAALGPIVEDWAEKYEDEEDEALWELVVFFIRASGSSAAIEKEKAVDLDGVPSFVDDLEKEESLGSYPLVSRDKSFRPFHGALTSFLHTFIHHVSLSDALYCGSNKRTEPSALMAVLQAWLFTLSHSPLRSFRHTGTVIALDIMTGLVEALKEVNEELSVVSRQKESERKKASASSREGKDRIKELDRTMKNVHWKKGKLEEYLQEFFNTVFVMRYRDLDEKIRAECVRHLGLWMRTLSSRYLEPEYFKYLGWMLDDIHAPTRLETVRALAPLYANETHLAALGTFTERFKSRLLEIAFHDVDLSVRTTTIGILGHIDKAGLLDDEKRSQIGLLVFEVEPRVRKAVAGFFDRLWADETEEALEALDIGARKGRKGKKAAEADAVGEAVRKRVGWKALAAMVGRFSQALDEAAGGADEEASQTLKGLSQAVRMKMTTPPRGRIAAAIDSLWDHVPNLREWAELIDFLGLDHSRPAEGDDAADQADEDAEKQAERAWKLDEDEEALLVQILLAALGKVKEEADKEDDDTSSSADLTRALIKHFPRLLTRYQGEVAQLADILAIPRLMHLETYLDLRMITAYETLWDDITKTYLRNSDFAVLNSALLTIRHLLETEALANSNATKVAELEDALFGALRDLIGDKTIATAAFEEDEVPMLEAACKRIGLLLSFRPTVTEMEENEREATTGWTLLFDLANRGSLGYQDEAVLVEECLESLTRYIFHRARTADSESARQSLQVKRAALLELLEEYTIGTQSNAIETVRRTSFRLLLTIYIFFNPIPVDDSHRKGTQSRQIEPALHLKLDDQVQWRCAGFVQAEIDKYAEELIEADDELSQRHDEEAGSDDELSSVAISDDEQGQEKPSKRATKAKQRKRANIQDISELGEAALQARWRFNYLITTFIQSLLSEVLDLEHAAVVLAHFGRFGPEYDELCKRLAEFIKGAACYGPAAPTAARVIVKAFQDASNLYMDGDVEEDQLLALAKVLSGILVVSGPHFKILARMSSEAFTSIHMDLLDWLIKVVGGHVDKGNKPKLRKALAIFKALPPLLAGATGRDALATHSHMADRFEATGVKITADKIWDHQRAYDKRLTSIMAKDSRIAKGARKQVAEADGSSPPPSSPTGAGKAAGKRKRPTVALGSGADNEDDGGAPAKTKKPRPKPKPRTTRKSADRIEDSDADAADTDDEGVMADENEPAEDMLDMGASSPEKAAVDSEPQLPPSSPLSQRSESAASVASIVVTKRKALALKT